MYRYSADLQYVSSYLQKLKFLSFSQIFPEPNTKIQRVPRNLSGDRSLLLRLPRVHPPLSPHPPPPTPPTGNGNWTLIMRTARHRTSTKKNRVTFLFIYESMMEHSQEIFLFPDGHRVIYTISQISRYSTKI